MLGVVPPYRPSDEAALLTVVNRWRKFPWEPFLIGWCVAFHALIAAVLAVMPDDVILTEGTRPVLDIADRWTWAVVFAAAAAAVALLWKQQPAWLQIVVWAAVVLFLGGMWLTAFALAVLRGEGSAVGVVVWPFLYGPWAIVAYLSLGKR